MQVKEIDTSNLPPDGGPEYNRLIFEQSPYLLQHADNPIAWYPWGEEALNRAAAEEKPIFLSIGYATCHWCHVMARESFSDSEVAAEMNAHFIAVKVDREERPDLDAIYMKISQEVTGTGGWPLNVILTPGRQPILIGTYFPKTDRDGRLGLMEILRRVAAMWQNDRQKLLGAADRVMAAVGRQDRNGPAAAAERQLIDVAYQQLTAVFDRQYGGFGRAPKFPLPHQYLFLLRYWRRTGDAAALDMTVKSLTALRQGGIYDQLGFGFHRYSTDRRFLLPHFEKMLYDQALAALAYLEAWQASGEELLAATAREIFTYVDRDLSAPEGGFYSAEDADSEGREGLFYLWREEEIEEVLGPEAARIFGAKYGVRPAGNFTPEAGAAEPGLNILHLNPADTATAELAASRQLLLVRRARRTRPLRDDKILTGWNGLMIAALARGGRVLNAPELTGRAARAADFILEQLRDRQGGLLHTWRRGRARIAAFQDDYAYLIWGLLELFDATFSPRYLQQALDLNRTMLAGFTDPETGGLNFSGRDNEILLLPVREFSDGALPAGNSVALLNLVKLARLTDDADLGERAGRLAAACAGGAAAYPAGQSLFLVALDLLTAPAAEAVVAGRRGEPGVSEALRLLNRDYAPERQVLYREEGAEGERLSALLPGLAGKTSPERPVTVYLCQDFACRRPLTDPAELPAALGKISPSPPA